jgi:hypothetical protein
MFFITNSWIFLSLENLFILSYLNMFCSVTSSIHGYSITQQANNLRSLGFDTIWRRRKQHKKDSKHKNIELCWIKDQTKTLYKVLLLNIFYNYKIFITSKYCSKMFLINAHVIFFAKHFCPMNSIFNLDL